jgi:hypothetical protein
VSTATRVAAPVGNLLDAIERIAWRIPLPTRRLFVALALAASGVLVVSSLTAAWVASRNAATIRDATHRGLGVARAATEFRTSLAAADAEAAATLISGGLEAPEGRASYESHLQDASHALADAGLVATPHDAEDLAALTDGLVRYAGLVETSRANSRQGYPVGSAYLNQARGLANDDLVPRADRLRRVGEQRVARAVNSVGGPIGALAVVVLVLALAALGVVAAMVAGRTRRLVHPALIAATVAVIAGIAVVAYGISVQSRQLRAASTTDIDNYVAANDNAFALSSLRVTEIAAVASRGSGAPLYEQFRADAGTLRARLEASDRTASLPSAIDRYLAGVDEVAATDTGGDNRAAAAATLSGDSAAGFEAASRAARSDVARTTDELARRFDRAASAEVEPLVPLGLGVVAAALAAAGTLARGRRYR